MDGELGEVLFISFVSAAENVLTSSLRSPVVKQLWKHARCWGEGDWERRG